MAIGRSINNIDAEKKVEINSVENFPNLFSLNWILFVSLSMVTRQHTKYKPEKRFLGKLSETAGN